jgi:hypothetical protein
MLLTAPAIFVKKARSGLLFERSSQGLTDVCRLENVLATLYIAALIQADRHITQITAAPHRGDI